jgi:hypothetical protein
MADAVGDPVEPDICAACRGNVHPDATRCRHCGHRFDAWWRTSVGTLVIGLAGGAAVVGLVWAFVVGPAEDDSGDRAEECAELTAAGELLAAENVCP